MKTLLSIAVIATLLFSSCNEGNSTMKISNLKGEWIMAKMGNPPSETNHLAVLDFGANGKLKQSYWVSLDGNKSQWLDNIYDYTLDDEQLILKNGSVDANFLVEFKLLSSAKNRLVYEVVMPQSNEGDKYELRRAQVDLKAQLVSVWEGRSVSADQDLTNFRWRFKADGTYIAYKKSDKGEWDPLEYEKCTYKLVDNVLITNWVSVDSEDQQNPNCELWTVNIDGNRMEWAALRPFGKFLSFRLERVK